MGRSKSCDLCATPPAFPVSGAAFTRRGFLRLASLGLMASFFGDVLSPSLLGATTAAAPALQGTARNCILIFLEGAPSQVDLWDLKEGPWTPQQLLAPTSFGGIRWPRGLLPKTAGHLDKLCIVRTGMAWVQVHPLAQRWSQIGRNPAGIMGPIAPHIGAVVALESQVTRRTTDVLPPFIAFDQPRATNGYFPSPNGPLTLRLRGDGSPIVSLNHADGAARLERRLQLLDRLDAERRGGFGKNAGDFGDLYPSALRLVQSPEIGKLFEVSKTTHAKYGSSRFGDSLAVAQQLLAADRGAHFVQTTSIGWDDHNEIYGNLPGRATAFDTSFAALLTDLAATPGAGAGKTLLDETLVVVYAEFGRTVGALNVQKGRDHLQRMSIVFAGGGVRGGRTIGATDELGEKALDYGWRADRDVRPEDVAATIYSAMGIDYTTVRHDDPLNRGFEYVPFARDGVYEPIDALFGA
jgi:hypothetical protein